MASLMPGLHGPTFWYESHAQDASKTPPDAPKATQDGPRNFKKAHKTPPRRFQDGPRRPQDASKTLPGRLQDGLASQDVPRRSQDAPKTAQDAPKTAQDAAKRSRKTAQVAPKKPQIRNLRCSSTTIIPRKGKIAYVKTNES